MIALFKGKYKLEDYKFLDEILDRVLIQRCMCDSMCSTCDKPKVCKDLHRLHNYVCKVIDEEKICQIDNFFLTNNVLSVIIIM